MQATSLTGFVEDVFRCSAETQQKAASLVSQSIVGAAQMIADAYRQGGTLFTCGNGGSAADAQHLSGEMLGRYSRTRRPLAAVSLSTDPSALTCIGNDFGYEDIFARQVEALATARDVLLAISTSGKSPSILKAVRVAQDKGVRTIGMTGGQGGELAAMVDVAIIVPATFTPRIQECHVTTLHALSELIEHLVLDLPLPPQQ